MEEKKPENQFSGMTREEIILEAKKQILHSAVLALAALIVIGVACYAWFVSTKTVTANVGPVTLAGESFELASVGSAGKYDTFVPQDMRIVGEEWTKDSQKGTQTSQEKQSILWNMTSENNLGNYSSEDEGIRPGSNGTLEFYVIRKQQSDVTVKAYLDIIPMKGGEQLTSNERLCQLLRGHLLFAYRVDDGAIQLAELSDGSFEVTVPADKEQVKVTVSWYWPYFLSHAIDYFGSFREEMSRRVVNSLKDDSDSVNYFFTDGAKDKYVGSDRNDSGNPITNVDGKITITVKNVRQYAKRLGEYYNEADQKIGDNVDSIVLRLRAEAG